MPGIPGFEQVPRYRELIDRLIAEDAEFVPPGFIFELDRPEWRFLKRELAWSTGLQTVGASVGNVSRLQVQNPSGSQRVVVVQGAGIINKASAGSFIVSRDDAGIVAGIIGNLALDTRVPLNASASRVVASRNAVANNLPAAGGDKIDQAQVALAANGYSAVLPVQPCILVPGTNCSITDAQQNEGASFIMWGYERAARPEELAA